MAVPCCLGEGVRMRGVERVEVFCPWCESGLWLPASGLGEWVKCPACSVPFGTDPGPLPDPSECWDVGDWCSVAVRDLPGRPSALDTLSRALGLLTAGLLLYLVWLLI